MPESPPATIVHGDYRLGNTMFGRGAPARLIAILDWEMATIGDPLADVGYMMIHWSPGRRPAEREVQPADASPLHRGFPTPAGAGRRATSSARAARCATLDWYVTLALWKAVVFMEGNYKRAISGSTDDPYLKSFGEGVVELAQRALEVTRDGF